MFLLWHPSLTAINLSYTFPILETSATALCGTTGTNWFCYSPWEFLGVNSLVCFVLFRCAFSASVKKSSEDGGNKKHWALASCGALFVSLHSCFLHVYWCLYCLDRTCTSPIFSILIVPSQPIAEVATGEALASTCSQVYRWQQLRLPHC